MLSKARYPHLPRVHRRHPQRLAHAMVAGGGVAPSNLLTTLLIRCGYWPDNDLSNAASAIQQWKAKRNEKPVAKESFVSRAWGKVKSFFGTSRGG